MATIDAEGRVELAKLTVALVNVGLRVADDDTVTSTVYGAAATAVDNLRRAFGLPPGWVTGDEQAIIDGSGDVR